MSQIKIQGNVSGTGVFTIESPATNTDRTLTLPDSAGTVLVGSVSSSTTNSVTNKIAVVINGTTYYLLASTSGT